MSIETTALRVLLLAYRPVIPILRGRRGSGVQDHSQLKANLSSLRHHLEEIRKELRSWKNNREVALGRIVFSLSSVSDLSHILNAHQMGNISCLSCRCADLKKHPLARLQLNWGFDHCRLPGIL